MKSEGLAAMFGGGEKPKAEGDASEGEDIARDILDAIKDDDAKALWLAIERAHEVCAEGYGADEKDETDDAEA